VVLTILAWNIIVTKFKTISLSEPEWELAINIKLDDTCLCGITAQAGMFFTRDDR